MFLRWFSVFKEPTGIVSHAFEAFSRDCILLELEMISILPIIVKLFLGIIAFAHLLRFFFFSFLSQFLKSGNKEL